MNIKHSAFRTISRASRILTGPASRGLRILTYHSVGGRLLDDPYGTCIAPDAFRKQMDALTASGLPLVEATEPHERLELALTFDDGYSDVLTNAAPLLVERNIPFTLFMTTAYLRDPSGLYLDLPRLKEVAALPGASIGSHGHTHARLDGLEDGELHEELRTSRRILEDALGRPVTKLSYPHGAVDKRVKDAACRTGYAIGMCSRYGINTPGRDPLLLCRTEVTAFDATEDFELKLRGHWDWFRFRHPDPAET